MLQMQQKGFMMTRKRFKKLMYSLGYQRNSINQWISQFRKENASDSRSYLFYYFYYPYLHYRENLDHFFESGEGSFDKCNDIFNTDCDWVFQHLRYAVNEDVLQSVLYE